MPDDCVFQSVSPIGDTDPLNLPVRDLESEIRFYEESLGFVVADRSDTPMKSARLTRGGVTLGFIENGGDPEQASCYIAVSDVDAAHREAAANGVSPTEIRQDEYGGNQYRVFFVRDPDGLCYCLGQHAD